MGPLLRNWNQILRISECVFAHHLCMFHRSSVCSCQDFYLWITWHRWTPPPRWIKNVTCKDSGQISTQCTYMMRRSGSSWGERRLDGAWMERALFSMSPMFCSACACLACHPPPTPPQHHHHHHHPSTPHPSTSPQTSRCNHLFMQKASVWFTE